MKIILPSDEIHIWRAKLPATNSGPSPQQQILLSPDEMARAEKFHFEKDRAAFVSGRASLRRILSYYCASRPQDLEFNYNRFGKPSLQKSAIQFNVSHSRNVFLFAIATDREVGIDIEALDRPLDYFRLAERFFSELEVEILRSAKKEMTPATFFRCWTRKEAYVKARGIGLSFPLRSFSVLTQQDSPALCLTAESSDWTIMNVDAGEGYAAAIAIEGEQCQVKYFDWNLEK